MTPWWFASATAAAALLIFGDLTHFTWWAVVQFYGYSLLSMVGLGHRYAITFVAQALGIIVSVGIMSALECDLLVDAAEEYGDLYLVLNFIVHYVPVLVVLAFPPELPAVNPERQLELALSMFGVYVTHPPGLNVYGCHLPETAIFGVITGLAVLLLTFRECSPSAPSLPKQVEKRPPEPILFVRFM